MSEEQSTQEQTLEYVKNIHKLVKRFVIIVEIAIVLAIVVSCTDFLMTL